MSNEISQGQMGTTTTQANASGGTETSQQSSSSSVSSPGVSTPQTATGTAETQAPQYVPNFKYRYMSADGSNRLEKEFDDHFRPLVKDAEMEKKIRELHERAYGLDFVKSDREKLKERFSKIESEKNELVGNIQTVGRLIKTGDLESFFKVFNVPEEQVLQWAVQKATMTPEQKMEYQSQQEFRRQMIALEEENERLKGQHQLYQSQSVQMRSMELDNALQNPEISSIVQSFDERVGIPGAFKTEVIRRGILHWNENGADIPVNQAIGEVMRMYGPQQSMQAPVVQQPQSAPAQAMPVIPNIQGKGTSPAKRIIKSTDELRKLATSRVG